MQQVASQPEVTDEDHRQEAEAFVLDPVGDRLIIGDPLIEQST